MTTDKLKRDISMHLPAMFNDVFIMEYSIMLHSKKIIVEISTKFIVCIKDNIYIIKPPFTTSEFNSLNYRNKKLTSIDVNDKCVILKFDLEEIHVPYGNNPESISITFESNYIVL